MTKGEITRKKGMVNFILHIYRQVYAFGCHFSVQNEIVSKLFSPPENDSIFEEINNNDFEYRLLCGEMFLNILRCPAKYMTFKYTELHLPLFQNHTNERIWL